MKPLPSLNMASTVNSVIMYPTTKERKRKSRGTCKKLLQAKLRHGIYHIYTPSASTQTSSFNLSQERLENVCQGEKGNGFCSIQLVSASVFSFSR